MLHTHLSFSRCSRHFMVVVFVLASLGFGPPALAADWPPVDAAHRQLTSDSLEGVPAVVLFRKARLRFRDYPVEANSQLDVQIRVKILTEEGTEYGNVEVGHSRWLRLDDFEGRTLAADGREVPLSPDQVFREQRSKRGKEFVTKAAFPAVEPGSIIDYRYTLYWNDLVYLEPWYFQTDLPALLSEIVYVIPGRYAAQPWGVQAMGRQVHSEVQKVPQGTALRLWMENAPRIPDEPLSPPDEALSSRFMMVPKSINISGQKVFLMDRWESVSELFEDGSYLDFRRRDGDVKKLAKELTRGLSGDREKAEAIFRYLRDEIRTDTGWGIWTRDTNANEVLEARVANSGEKALMMRTMLDQAKIDADLVWAAHRDRGPVDLTVANPAWFDGVLVRVDLDSGPVFLDASDPGLAFGQLIPGFEGMSAVTVRSRKPETLELPVSDPDDSERRAELSLSIDEEGRLVGSGSLVQTGHWAWAVINGSDDLEARTSAWEDSLEKSFPSFDLEDLVVEEDADASRVRLSWSMAQREEEILGDEVAFAPAHVFRSLQPFEAETRVNPVQFDLNKKDVVKVEVQWPEGWEIESVPEMIDMLTPVGDYRVEVSWDDEARSLSYLRILKRPAGEYGGPETYSMLRSLYEASARIDAANIAFYQP